MSPAQLTRSILLQVELTAIHPADPLAWLLIQISSPDTVFVFCFFSLYSPFSVTESALSSPVSDWFPAAGFFKLSSWSSSSSSSSTRGGAAASEEIEASVFVAAGTSAASFLNSARGGARSNLLASCLGVKAAAGRCDGVET